MTWYGAGYLSGTGTGWPGDTALDTNYVAFWRTAYADMIRIKAQAMESVLQPSVEPETIRGRSLVLDSWTNVVLQQRLRGQQYGAITAGASADKKYEELLTERRQVETEFWEYAEFFDQRDDTALMRAVAPGGQYSRAVTAGFNRKKDEVIIAAFDATVNNYPSGTTPFDTANQEVAHNFNAVTGDSSGLSVKKMIEANRILKTNPANPTVGGIGNDGDWHIALHPSQLSDLLNVTTVTSSDFNVVKALVSGELNSFVGFQFHETPLIQQEGAAAFFTTGSITGKYAYCYHRSAMVFGMSSDFMVRFDELPQRGYGIQAFHQFGLAAMRMDEAKIVRIECEDPATIF